MSLIGGMVFGALPQASESKKEAFRKYLEASGVLDSLTKGPSVFLCFHVVEPV